MVMYDNIFTETPLCGKGVSVSTREAQPMMLRNLGLWLTRFKVARAKPDLEALPRQLVVQITTGLEALSNVSQGLQPSPRGLLTGKLEKIASVCTRRTAFGAKPKRKANMRCHFM